MKTLLAILFLAWAPTVNAAEVLLSWSDNSLNEEGFNIERRVGAGPFIEIGRIGANVVSFTDSTASDTLVNCYRFAAFNAAGSSAFSGEACISFLQPPAAPSHPVAVAQTTPTPQPPPSTTLFTAVFNGITQDFTGGKTEVPDGF